MLRGNLSTRPFYNDRAVTVVIAAIAVVVVLLTVVNVTQLMSLSSRWGDVQGRLVAAREDAAAIRTGAAAAQQDVDRGTLMRLAASTEEANRLIEARTFSWTALFGRLERAMPMDVRLVSVSPRVDETGLMVEMTIAARELMDVDLFVTALQDTGVFYDVSPTTTQAIDDGTVTAQVTAVYLGTAGEAVPGIPPAVATAAPEGRP
jgi:hypothetical protein